MAEFEIPREAGQKAEGDFSAFVYGAVYYPLGENASPLPSWAEKFGLLRDADPSRFYYVDFVAWALGFFLQKRWGKVCADVGVGGRRIVSGVSLVDPSAFLTADSLGDYAFPLLAVHRVGSRTAYVSTDYAYRESKWKLRYVLPAMGVKHAEQLEPILRAVEAVVDWVAENPQHPAYAPPGQPPGTPISTPALSGIQEIESGDSVVTADEREGDGMAYLAVSIDLQVKERRMEVERPLAGSPGVLAGIDADEPLGTVGGTTLDGLVEVQTDGTNPPYKNNG